MPKSNTETADDSVRRRVRQIHDSRKFEQRLRQYSLMKLEIIKFRVSKVYHLMILKSQWCEIMNLGEISLRIKLTRQHHPTP